MGNSDEAVAVFSSAADIVSGAYPIPSRPSSVVVVRRPSSSVVNFFSNWIGFLSFHPIFPIFGLNVHNNIAHKTVGPEFLIFASKFFYGLLFTKNRSKLGILEVFGNFLKKFLCGAHETWFTDILWVLLWVCEKWPLWAKFSGPFGPQIGPKLVKM